MKNNKKAISLIVLVITIIVMIILAASVVITLSNTGIIDRANEATYETELKQIQDLAALAWSDAYTAKMTDPTIDIEEEIKVALEKQGIARDRYIIEVTDNGVAIKAYTKTGSIKNTTVSGQSPLVLNNSAGVNLLDYKIYGNSIQNGTPSPTSPVEVQSVGEKTKNLFDCFLVTAGDYKLNEMLDNGYGTTVDSNIYDGEIKVTQTQYPDPEYLASYFNGFFSVGVNSLEAGKTYTLYYEFEILNNPLNAEGIEIFMDSKHYVSENNGNRAKVTFVSASSEFNGEIKDKYIEFRNCGMSLKLKKLMLLEGEVEGYPEYEPLGYKIPVKVNNGANETVTNIYLDEPLRKIGEHADYIDFANNKVVRKVKRIIVDGNTYKYDSFNASHNNRGSFRNNEILNSDYRLNAAYCTHFPYNKDVYRDTTSDEVGFIVTGNMCYFRYTTSSNINTIDLANEWLISENNKETPLKLFGVLSTLNSQTITLPNIPNLKGNCVISVETSVKPSNIEVTYKGIE